ncbi:hypothetical protein SO802_015792 [Lithocarpus litseifolius]|uniref:Small nuclear ribonucleoprotein E n=1 Tax=Lithocarpus litseifolius TaxID=425828 RepID=A0AAW2CYB4_9ROSI
MASTKVQRIMTQPINLIFRFLQSKARIQIWLFEQRDLRIEGRIIGFDEYMNLVLDDAEEVNVKKKSRKSLVESDDDSSNCVNWHYDAFSITGSVASLFTDMLDTVLNIKNMNDFLSIDHFNQIHHVENHTTYPFQGTANQKWENLTGVILNSGNEVGRCKQPSLGERGKLSLGLSLLKSQYSTK